MREKGIIHEYIMFVKIYTEQCRVCKTKAEAITETLRICKNEDILKEYLESRESEVYSMLDVLFDRQYQEEAMRKDSFREGKEEGREEGRKEGRKQGEILKLITMVKKKIENGDSIAKIADDLLEDADVIEKIYDIVKENPEKTREEIWDSLMNATMIEM